MMKNDDIDAIQWYSRLVESVMQIAMSAEEQAARLSGFVITDEIASDFSDIGMVYAKRLLECEWITQEQFLLAQKIDKKLDDMSQKRELWTDKALFTSEEWNACRELGKNLLETLERSTS